LRFWSFIKPEKCGCQKEGVLRQAYYYRGRRVDFVIYGMLRAEAPDFEKLLEEYAG